MTISVNQQVDFLWKKLGFGLAKTSVPSLTDATNERIISNPFLPGDKIWAESSLIPTVLPIENFSVVEVHAGGGSAATCTMDITSPPNRTWLTHLTDWIPTSYGSTYQVKVFLAPPTSTNPQGDGIQLYAAGTNNSDEWFFDYSAGVLHFMGDNLPAIDFTNKTIFIYGGRYCGAKGLGHLSSGTFGDITISGNTISSAPGTITFLAGSGGHFGGAVSITIDGKVVSTFDSKTANIANLSITGSSVSSIGDFIITPSAGKIVKANTNTALQIPVGTTAERPEVPETGYMRFNTSANVLECFNGVEWVSAQTIIDDQVIICDGVAATYMLNKASAATNLLVAKNGVIQLPNVAYTVVGDIITFAVTPQSTDIIEVRFIGQSVSPIATVSDTQIIDGSTAVISTTPTVIDTFAFWVYRSAKYLISMTFQDGNSQMADVMVTHNGFLGAGASVDSQILATMTPVTGGTATVITFNTYVGANMCTLTATSSTPNTIIKMQKIYFSM